MRTSVELRPEIRRYNIFFKHFIDGIIANKKPVYSDFFTAFADADLTEFNKVMEELQDGAILVSQTGSGENCELAFSNPKKSLIFRRLKNEDAGTDNVLDFMTSDKELFDNICNRLAPLKGFVPKHDSQVMLVHRDSSGEYYLKTIGSPVLELKETNYMPNVIDDINDIKSRLFEENAFGKLVIIDGPPGTGKTSLIRTLITNNDKSVFVIFPINLLGTMDSSAFIAFLAEQNAIYQKPITLILEDADSCLLPREEGNMSFISILLNAADGIIGQCIDNRIIATTNSSYEKIDEAITRPGRLLKRLHIDKLSPERAKQCLHDLTGTDTVVDKPLSLAECYEIANNVKNNRPVAKQAKKVGFSKD